MQEDPILDLPHKFIGRSAKTQSKIVWGKFRADGVGILCR